MTRDQREAYQEMQAKNELSAKDIDEKQTRLESLTQATDALQRELDSNPVKREAGVSFRGATRSAAVARRNRRQEKIQGCKGRNGRRGETAEPFVAPQCFSLHSTLQSHFWISLKRSMPSTRHLK